MVDKIYLSVPHWIKNILVSLFGLKQSKVAKGSYFEEKYLQLKQNTTNTVEQLSAYQVKMLNNLLLEAYKHCEHYRKVFDDKEINQLTIKDNKSLEFLKHIPYLEKDTLRKYMNKVVSANPQRPTTSVVNTSGTTGMPMTIEIDKESKQSTAAEWRRYSDWLGLPKAFKSVRFSGRIVISPTKTKKPFWVYNAPNKQLFMSSYHLTDVNISSYIKKIDSFQPELLDGYPSAFYIIARFMLQNKISLSYKPLAISTTAETLLEHHRDIIEKAFGCTVYNQYASSEGSPWIVQCEEGSYHLWTDTGVFEYIDQKDNGDGTIMSELVVTSFRNFKTPLIRYRIGDMVSRYKEEKLCSCGSFFPIVHSVIGRMDDVLYTEEKGSVGRLDPAFKGLGGIKQSKISQIDINTIKVYIVPGASYSDSVGQVLLQNLHDRLGLNVNIELIKTDKITLGKNAKFKSVERLFTIKGDGK